ncbi:MAG: AbrB/MazE/SpoVT family DNA-binding domain-containing protein [Pseudomonadota bacterium]|jgi:antitoxin MazE
MRSQVKKWGNSASVRIPANVLSAAAMRIDQDVEIREEDGRIVIEAIAGPRYDLDTLLARITPENMPDDIDFGTPVGGEVW